MKRIILLVCLGLNFFFGSAKTFTSLSNSKFRFINQKVTEPLFHSFGKVFNNYSDKKDKNNLPPCDVTANISYANAPFCFSITTPQSVSLIGTGVYTGGVFASSFAGLTINSNTGAIIPSTSIPGSYTVTYTVSGGTGCPDVVASTTVVINSVPFVANQNFTTCSDVIIGFILGTTPSTTYNITAINSNGLTASAGNAVIGNNFTANEIADDAWTNITPLPVNVIYTIVPVSATGCQGNPFTVTVTVNPEPVVLNQTSTICSDVALGVTLGNDTDTPQATTYNITNINFNGLTPFAGNPVTGTGFSVDIIADDAWTNTNTVPVNVVYTVVPVSVLGCEGNPFTVVITVESTLGVGSQTVTACSDAPIGFILGTAPNTTYTITNINPDGLTASAGNPVIGNNFIANVIADDAWTNSTSAAVDVVYTVYPVSSNGCIGQPFSVTVTVNPQINIIVSTTPITCYGAADASIFLTVTGGTAPYTSQWDNLATGFYQYNLSAGIYLINITDALGCINYASVIIPEVPIFTVNPVVVPVSCFGANNGSINLNLIGGVQPVSVSWSDGSNSGLVRNNLGPGTYTVIITDSNSCTIVRTFTIVEPLPRANVNSTICSDVANGIILGNDIDTPQATTYNITNINSNGLPIYAGNPTTGTGLAANVIADDAWTNTTPNPVDVVYTVVPVSAAGCQGDPFTVTVTVNPCSGFHLNAFLDSNSNGTQDSGENNFPFGQFIYQVNSITHNVATVTGMYDIFESNAASIYTLQYSINPQLSSYFSVTPTSYTNVQIASTGGITTYNFPITINQLNDLGITLIPLGSPVPGFNFQNLILYTNYGTANSSGSITFTKHPALSIVSTSDPLGTTITSSGFNYTFSNLNPSQSQYLYFTINTPILPTVSLGQVLCNTASISPASGIDMISSNNSSTNCSIVVGSYDPNDIVESRGREIEFNSFTTQDYLYYTIRFENTGNGNAINININNTLDNRLDETTMEMVSSSHDYSMDRVGTVINWNFLNIQLPPSVAQTNTGKGFIMYKIKPRPGYAIGDVIPNTASIYFDFNPAIITNTFETQFVTTLETPNFENNNFVVYPNPAKEQITIDFGTNSNTIGGNYRIVNTLGQEVLNGILNSQQNIIQLSNIKGQGIYFVKIYDSSNKLMDTKKIIIQQ